METESRRFFEELITTPGTSGYEQQVQAKVRGFVKPFADSVTTDLHGNVIAAVNPDASFRIMLAGHCDQIGFLVHYIDPSGFISVVPVGGWDIQILLGQKVLIWGKNGPVSGALGRKAIHLLTPEERKQVPKIHDLWIDIGVNSADEANEYVKVGDMVTMELGIREMPGQLVCGPAMDNRAGVWVVMEALRRASSRNPECGIFSVSTVQEEIGLRGAKTSAFSVDPQVGFGIDVTHATDCPTVDKRIAGDVALSKGPVVPHGPNMNPRLVQRLEETAEKHELPFQYAASGKAQPNDTNVLQVNRGGVATALVSIPLRYMHTPVEIISLKDLDSAAELLACTIAEMKPDDNFIP
ncbi:Aminopeptidase YsdC [Planctomycetales bacterium 10988]|nr:Aminopeptidase YsdC [Planctomycetales bacterium 10988]